MEKTNILVTISLLVSNRIDTIRKCMESIRPILEQLPSELIVVDTVGEENSDGSLAIAKEYATEVVRFEWCDDFSAARNAGLSQARGEWFLTLDDDEWFEDVAPILDFFISGDYAEYERAGYSIRNYTDKSGDKYEVSYRFGLQKLSPESCYVGKIHEAIEPAGTKEKQLPVYAHHYGYAYETENEKLAHAKRNITLIEKELKEKPDNLRMQVQLLQEYKASDDLIAERELCEHIVANYRGDVKNDIFQYVLANLIRAARDSGREEGRAKMEWIEHTYPLNLINKVWCALEHMELALSDRKAEQVVTQAEVYLNFFEETKKVEYSFPEYNDIVSEEKLQLVMLEGIKAMLQVSQFETAELFFDAVDWNNEKDKPYEQMELLLKVYGATGNGKLLFVHANRIIRNKKLISVFQAMINTFVSENPGKLEVMRKHLAGEY